MSYGQNLAWGLQATKSLNASTWNGQVNPYFINAESGVTATSIYRGDPVVMETNGYIVSLYEGGTLSTTPILGVFDGCSYVQPTSANPIDPASPGRLFWPAGTLTLNNIPPVAFVIDDPNTIFNIQTNSSDGLTQANMGNTFNVAQGTVGVGNGLGNTSTGISGMMLDQASAGTSASANLKAIRLVARTGNNAGVAYNNAEVIIQNHFYCSRPAGI